MENLLQEGFDSCCATNDSFTGLHYFLKHHFISSSQKPSTLRNKYFDALSEPETTVDPLDDWLSSAVIITTADPITWWTGMEATGHPLARMALDFVSIPGKGVQNIHFTSLCSQMSVFSRLYRRGARVFSWWSQCQKCAMACLMSPPVLRP
jgi:hypothetical protein